MLQTVVEILSEALYVEGSSRSRGRGRETSKLTIQNRELIEDDFKYMSPTRVKYLKDTELQNKLNLLGYRFNEEEEKLDELHDKGEIDYTERSDSSSDLDEKYSRLKQKVESDIAKKVKNQEILLSTLIKRLIKLGLFKVSCTASGSYKLHVSNAEDLDETKLKAFVQWLNGHRAQEEKIIIV